VDNRDGLDGVEKKKFLTLQGLNSDPSVVQPLASRYTGSAIPALIYIIRTNTSTATLRVVGGDEKENLKSETVQYGRDSHGIRARERLRWQRPAAYTKGRPVLSSEKAPHQSMTVTVKP
jgi:hypothetical protein